MKDTCKILVLSDLNKSASKTLKSAVTLAKIMDAKIDFFYVKKPTEVVLKRQSIVSNENHQQSVHHNR